MKKKLYADELANEIIKLDYMLDYIRSLPNCEFEIDIKQICIPQAQFTFDGVLASKIWSAISDCIKKEIKEKRKEYCEVMKKEEWQSTDSGYLNCIGVGDTYVRKQMERIMNSDYMECSVAFRGSVLSFKEDYKVTWGDENKR